MTEEDALNQSDDKYSDTQMEICSECHLPKMLVTYELGFRLIQAQLIQLRTDLQQLVNKIDTLEHKRDI